MTPGAAHELLTVGHGTLSQSGFIDLLEAATVELLVDVRSAPGSRRHPQFRREAMEVWVPQAGIGYRWEPRLGGFRRARPGSRNVALVNPSFRGYADHMEEEDFTQSLGELIALAWDRRTTVMCSEAVWWRCHRRLIADAATLLCGARVRHLAHDGRLSDHRPTDGVRIVGSHLRYDAGQEPLLEPDPPADAAT